MMSTEESNGEQSPDYRKGAPPIGHLEEIETPEVEGAVRGSEDEAIPSPDSASTNPSHVWNPDIHVAWRYGIPLCLVANAAFLLVSHISSGVVAMTQIIYLKDNTVFSEDEILTVSVISSVSALWNADSKALAVFIAITSVMLPYLKLLLSLIGWILPYRTIQRRERYLECVDVLGKWSFVDIFVLIIIMVAFRKSISISSVVVLEVYILPRWGFYAFVAANMLSLIISQTILYLHRQLQYHPPTTRSSRSISTVTEPTREITVETIPKPEGPIERNDEEAVITTEMINGDVIPEQMLVEPKQNEEMVETKVSVASQTGISVPLLVVVVVACLVLHFVGCSISIFEITNSRGTTVLLEKYSVFSVGAKIPGATMDPNEFGIRFIQFMYYLIVGTLPAWNIVLLTILYLCPMVKSMKEKTFFLTEITFSWAAGEVLVLSTIFSILQIPKFGNKLIESGCKECNKVDSLLYPEFSVLCVSMVLNVCVNVYLFHRAHKLVLVEPDEVG